MSAGSPAADALGETARDHVANALQIIAGVRAEIEYLLDRDKEAPSADDVAAVERRLRAALALLDGERRQCAPPDA